MRAFVLDRYGGPACERWTELEAPKPKTYELLVKGRAAGLNPVLQAPRRPAARHLKAAFATLEGGRAKGKIVIDLTR